MNTQVIILAAGQGKRMYSSLPKVLHQLGGQPLLAHVLQSASTLSSLPPIIVYGHQGERVRQHFAHINAHWVEQPRQLGTGHAVLQTLPLLAEDHAVLVLYGDVPLISQALLKQLIQTTPAQALGMITAQAMNPTGYGRIQRDSQQRVVKIIEEKDATPEERATLLEVNSGIYYLPAAYLKKYLPLLNQRNHQGEYYLTDVIAQAVQDRIDIHTVQPLSQEDILGVNDRMQLADLERIYQARQAEMLMQQGACLLDPARLDIRGAVTVGQDVTIYPNVILEGRVILGDGCVIGPYTLLRDVTLGRGVEIKSHSVLEDAFIGDESVIGPFARLRPHTKLAQGVHIGNFVEIKQSQVGEYTKINHLSYIGDSEIGRKVNIGAGTITCNYDGANKHRTIIGDEVHIGSDTQLVAPIRIGNGATVGAGSTIIKDVPPQQLTLTHNLKQRSIPDWKRPEKKSE